MPHAALAPEGSRCSVHPSVTGATVCARCGAFMCGECSNNNTESLCPKCLKLSGFDAKALALAYKKLVMWFGVQLVASLTRAMPTPIAIMGGLLLLGTVVMVTIYAYRTAMALGSNVAWLWAIAMLVPCVNCISLLILSAQATSACRERNIPVGLFGPKV